MASEEQTMDDKQSFDLRALERALTELGRRCCDAGRTIEIAVYGGSALLLTLNRQVSTHDVDAVFEKDKGFVRRLAADMAAEFGWEENWLNDGVKGWFWLDRSASQAAKTRLVSSRNFTRTM
jgi:hypothetical protein